MREQKRHERLKRMGDMKQKKENSVFENQSMMIWNIAIASALSWEIAKFTGSQHPYLAPLTIILCIKTTLEKTILFSFYRFVGTVIGIILIVLLAKYVQVNGFTLGIFILGGSFIAKWMKFNKVIIEQVALSILLVLALEQQSSGYAWDRIKDTLIGAIVAILVKVYVFPSSGIKRATKVCNNYSNHLTGMFIEFSNWIKGGCDPVKGVEFQNQLKKDYQYLDQMKMDLNQTSKAFSYFPFCSKKGEVVKILHQKTKNISKGYLYLSNVTGTFKEWGKAGTMTDQDKASWANQMKLFSERASNISSNSPIVTNDSMIISIPMELINWQYHVSLFQETKEFLNGSSS